MKTSLKVIFCFAFTALSNFSPPAGAATLVSAVPPRSEFSQPEVSEEPLLNLPMMESSRYQTLAQHFALGTTVSFKEINNDSQIWRGHCFYRSHPNLSLNSIIGTYVDTQNITASPFFTAPRNYFAVLGLEDSQKRFLPADAFGAYSDEYIKSIAEFPIERSVISGDMLPAYESNNSLIYKYYSSSHYLTSESLRKYKDGIILEADVLFDGMTYFDRATGENATLKKRGPFAFCHYTKTTQP